MSATFGPQNPLRVAVVGGGIGGLCTAIALLEHPNIDVQIYEAAATFGEIGAGVGFGPNVQQALKLIGPGATAAYDNHVTGNLWPKYAKTVAPYIVGEGKHEGELIYTPVNARGQKSVHRAHFLNELVKLVPSQRTHFNRRVAFLEDQQDGSIILRFKDGTIAAADALIGADGVHSVIRAHLLGAELAKPVFSGSAAYRALVPMDKAVKSLGEEFASNTRFICGRGGALVSYPIDGGSTLNVAIFDFDYQTWEHDKWVLPADTEALRSKYSTWSENSRNLVELLLGTEHPSLWAMWDHAPAPTYVKGRIAMMGDAAHASTPYQGQGAGQALEDAVVLACLLGEVTEPSMIKHAFLAYDQVRRVRTQRVVSVSRHAGQLIAMRAEGVGSDLDKMREILRYQSLWIWNRDLKDQNAEALLLFRESIPV